MNKVTIEEVAQVWLECVDCYKCPFFERCKDNDKFCQDIFIDSMYELIKGED